MNSWDDDFFKFDLVKRSAIILHAAEKPKINIEQPQKRKIRPAVRTILGYFTRLKFIEKLGLSAATP